MEKGRKTTRMRLKADEAALVNNYRAIKEQSQSMGLDPKTVHSGWLIYPTLCWSRLAKIQPVQATLI